jgi:epoxide hydrolase-like predicted phosphatase
MIKVVLFDFGGVLTESGKKGYIAETVAGLYGIPAESVDIADLHGDLRRGKSDTEAFFTELNRRYGQQKQVTEQMFQDKTRTDFRPSPLVYDVAKRLRDHGIRTAILSNIFNMNAVVLREQGWYDGFDPVLLSYDLGYAKPDPEIYDITLERLGVRPDEVLFIDDQDKCLAPAEKIGMHTIKAVSPEQIVVEIQAIIRKYNGVTL